MAYTDDIFKRMDIQQVRSYLLGGLEDTGIDNDSYENRLKKANDPVYRRLESLCRNADELDETLADLSDALAAYEAVYTELGMKFGARIIFQL